MGSERVRSQSGITINHDPDGTPREVRYLTDDRDSRHPLELVIGWGNNGDWYIYTAPEGEGSFNMVRLCTSGGISSRVPGVNPLIAQIFRLLTNTARAPAEAGKCRLCGHDEGPWAGMCQQHFDGDNDCGCHCDFAPVASFTPDWQWYDTQLRATGYTDLANRMLAEFKPASVAPVASEPVGEQGWRPITEAPKDGRTLLLGYWNQSGKWRTTRGQWFTDEQIAEWENADFEADWYETSVENDEPPNCWLISPTHWQPLPAPPKESN